MRGHTHRTISTKGKAGLRQAEHQAPGLGAVLSVVAIEVELVEPSYTGALLSTSWPGQGASSPLTFCQADG